MMKNYVDLYEPKNEHGMQAKRENENKYASGIKCSSLWKPSSITCFVC